LLYNESMHIGIDLDEVVVDTLGGIIKLHNEKYGTRFAHKDFASYHLQDTWGGTREEAIEKVDKFLKTDPLKHFNPVAGSITAIKTLKERGHELYIITGRSNENSEHTETWLKHHFPKVFSGVHYVSFYSLTEKPRKKSEVCRELGIELIIDDNWDTAVDCAAQNIKVLLFDQQWNRGKVPKNVERVHSWDEILKKL
jgi:uncharacterized HAD superfamily protein